MTAVRPSRKSHRNASKKTKSSGPTSVSRYGESPWMR
jgi:hypothetical protein